ncbi:hypothetical protein J0H58_33500 [bacterium]|nr:hypothetical protein [bacterium]
MADSTPSVRDPGPPLGSTADPVGYVPVSWMAVASFAVTAVFVLVLGALAFTAWRSKSPLIAPQLLFLPVVAVVLAFAARRLVRNSEGTRTAELFGFDLVNGAWWGAVVVGLVYLTYMAAVEFSIRREAEAEVGRWVGLITKDDLTRAFHRTRDPAERASIAPDNGAALEARYRNDWIAFSQCDLARIAVRNPGACEYTPGSLRDWAIKPGGVECVATGTLRCPEGVFPVQFSLRAVDATGPEGGAGRQWQFLPGQNGFLREEPKLTPYGWLVLDLQRQGREQAERFLSEFQNRGTRPYVAYAAAGMAGDPALRLLSRDAGAARVAAVGVTAGLGWQIPEPMVAATAAKLFRMPGNKQPTPEQGRIFLSVWTTTGIVPAGSRLRQSPDTFDVTTLSETAVEVRVPVELPLVSAKGDMAARGRVVMVCSDAGLLDELKRLRAEAKPDAGSIAPPGTSRPRYPWRLDRIESDLKPVSSRENEPPMPGGM